MMKKQYELMIKYKSGEVDEMYTRLTGKGWETEAATPEEALQEMKENDPETFEQIEANSDAIERYWVEEITEEPISLSFEAGDGRHFEGGVNYMISEAGKIYAEIAIPNEITDQWDEYGNHPAELEDYGYLDLKEAILSQYKGSRPIRFWYDGQEDKLDKCARTGGEVYTEIEED